MATRAAAPAPRSTAARESAGRGRTPRARAERASIPPRRENEKCTPRAIPCREHPNKRRAHRADDLVTPQGRYPAPWATDLAQIFSWDDILQASARGGTPGSGEDDERMPKRIVLDGANIAWSLGTSIRSRFKCRQFPLSAGIVAALEHEPWARQNYDVVAFVPKEYVVGTLNALADGGGLATLNADVVKYLGKNLWVNTRLMDLVDAGKVKMVSRDAGSEGAKSDDLTIIEYAKDNDAWICSNDQFRDHRRNRSLGFSGARDLKAFARSRRFEHAFRVAPGLDDELLTAMRNASGWVANVGVANATRVDGSPVPEKVKAGGRRGPGGGFRRRLVDVGGARGRALEASADLEENIMASMMDDDIMERGGGDGDSESGGEEDEEEDGGPRTRNDHENALNGVPAYYAMPQSVLPVFFEPAPTAAMIAARQSFLKRQGLEITTMGGK